VLQFSVFLLLGIGLWAWYEGAAFARSDEIFARFIIESLPPGWTGLLVAGVLAAAMSSLSSSISALASASAYDFWAPLVGATDDDARVGRVGRMLTLLWAAALVAGAWLFLDLGEGAAAVEVALGIASIVYGGLLGAFLLAIASTRADARSVAIGMLGGIALVAWIGYAHSDLVAWPWYVLLGSSTTALIGWGLGRGQPIRRTHT
jgi:Na+/proline symporter